MKRLAALCALIALPVSAQPADDRQAFIDANVVSAFYHELGHALIDIMELSVLGQEEGAADTLSALLTDELWEEEAATGVIKATSQAFLASADETGGDVAYWDVHGTDEQRHYALVCLFYGANPDARSDVATELGLPDERAETCPEEYDLAAQSWGTALDELANSRNQKGLRMTGDTTSPLAALLAAEVEAINDLYPLPAWVDVEVADCDEVNAFYSPETRIITICTEYAAYMGDLFDSR